ncbi:MAG: hypothetical protein ABW046_01205 [Actinoplanes sp.]
MTEQTQTRIPAPLYAAAGAGDLALQQLRKLPAVVNELSERAAASLKTYNGQAGTKASELRDKAATTDFDALRTNAATAATSFAQIAQDRALAAYTALVARGERVVGTGVVGAADVVNADLVTTEEPKAVEAATPAVTATPADVAAAVPTAKPRKRAAKPATDK